MGIDPVSLTMIGTAVSTVGSVVGMMAQMEAASYQQAVAERNARISEENAIKALERSQVDQQDWGQEARAQLGRMMADLSASGISATGGTPLLQRRGAESLSKRDAERVRREGVTQAEEYRQQSADFSAEAGMAGRRKTFALFGGVANTLGTYISGATQVNQTRNLMAKQRMIR
jgi:hypothetical protein